MGPQLWLNGYFTSNINNRYFSISIPLLTRIDEYVGFHAQSHPDKEFLVFNHIRMSFAEVEKEVGRLAKALIASGIKRGDRVAFFSTPRYEFFIHFLATASIGAIWVGLNPKYKIDELQYVIRDAQPKMIFGFSKLGSNDHTNILTTLFEDNAFIESLILLDDENQSWHNFIQRSDSIDDKTLASRRNEVNTMDGAFIVYTSGSTGRPKGAVLTHYGVNFCSIIAEELKSLKGRKIICNLPINHVGALSDICSRVLVGAGTIFFQEVFDPEEMMALIDTEKIDTWGGVPTMFQLCISHPTFESVDLSSVELVVWGGAAIPIDLLYQIREKTGAKQYSTGYGMTETTGGVTFSDFNDPLEKIATVIGKKDDRIPMRVLTHDGREAEVGEKGEVQVKGDFLFKEYWRKPKETAASYTEDGWFKTGDVAELLDDGNYKFIERISRMYKSGGYNVYPREIELCLESHESVDLAAVVNVSDDVFQEVGHAFIIANRDISEIELKTFLKTSLANYKVPKRIFIRESLPILPIGKVDIITLRKEAQERLEA